MVLEYGSLTLAVILLYLVYYHPLEFHYHVAKGLLSSLWTNSLINRNTMNGTTVDKGFYTALMAFHWVSLKTKIHVNRISLNRYWWRGLNRCWWRMLLIITWSPLSLQASPKMISVLVRAGPRFFQSWSSVGPTGFSSWIQPVLVRRSLG